MCVGGGGLGVNTPVHQKQTHNSEVCMFASTEQVYVNTHTHPRQQTEQLQNPEISLPRNFCAKYGFATGAILKSGRVLNDKRSYMDLV